MEGIFSLFCCVLHLWINSVLVEDYSSSPDHTSIGNASISSSPKSQLNKAQLAIAEAMALKMKKQSEDRKRKREEQERREKVIKKKVEGETKKLDEDEKYAISSTKELYAIFNDLQGISHEYVISSFFTHFFLLSYTF